jgi:hypothetical protein
MEQTMTDRKQRAVVLYLEKSEKGFDIVMDDACRNGKDWSWDVHVTRKLIDEKVWEDLSFQESELSDFGYYIMARLNAFRTRGEI